MRPTASEKRSKCHRGHRLPARIRLARRAALRHPGPMGFGAASFRRNSSMALRAATLFQPAFEFGLAEAAQGWPLPASRRRRNLCNIRREGMITSIPRAWRTYRRGARVLAQAASSERCSSASPVLTPRSWPLGTCCGTWQSPPLRGHPVAPAAGDRQSARASRDLPVQLPERRPSHQERTRRSGSAWRAGPVPPAAGIPARRASPRPSRRRRATERHAPRGPSPVRPSPGAESAATSRSRSYEHPEPSIHAGHGETRPSLSTRRSGIPRLAPVAARSRTLPGHHGTNRGTGPTGELATVQGRDLTSMGVPGVRTAKQQMPEAGSRNGPGCSPEPDADAW